MNELVKTLAELYRRGRYDLVPAGELPDGEWFYLSDKQKQAMVLINDDTTLFVGYGGAARAGKTVVECYAAFWDCMAYPGVAWALGRRELTVLKKTVIRSLNVMLDFYGLKDKIHYTFNHQLNKIHFRNQSEIFFLDTAYAPSDPLFTRFHGLELTRAAIDESNETVYDGVGTLFSRTGWWKNDKYGLKRKMVETFNPDHTHVYQRYWQPHRDNVEPLHKKFIKALPKDNPHPAVKSWIEDIIKEGDPVRIARLVNGDFDYSDDPSDLCDFAAINDAFDTRIEIEGEESYISADLAMQGRDKFVVGFWQGLRCTVVIDEKISTARLIELKLKELKLMNGVPSENLVADSDGLGAYLESYISNMNEFHGGSNAVNKMTFGNLKDECGFKLAELINNRAISIKCTPKQAEQIKKELTVCLKRDNVDVYKKRIINKKEQKKLLGCSPDYYDMLMMRMTYLIGFEEINNYMADIEYDL